MIHLYPPDVSGGEIEDKLFRMTDGTNPVIAAEVFDAPEAHEHPAYEFVGMWVVGDEDEVYAWLEDQGYSDFNIQYSIGPPE